MTPKIVIIIFAVLILSAFLTACHPHRWGCSGLSGNHQIRYQISTDVSDIGFDARKAYRF